MDIKTIRLSALQLITRDHSGWPMAEQIKAADDFVEFIAHGAQSSQRKIHGEDPANHRCLLDADNVK